ncbi:hypothetical protein MBH78_05480 [Oceanimonas sp. NS1]|nr:hypothetical protein [Oceanimonas sp. NS1]
MRASEQAVLEIRDFCEQHGIDAELRIDGTCYTATNGAQSGAMDRLVAVLEHAGLNSWSSLNEGELLAHTGSEAHLEGHFSPWPVRCSRRCWCVACAGWRCPSALPSLNTVP